MQETFSDLFGSYHLNDERRDNDRRAEISLGEQRENGSISHPKRWGLGLRPSPLLLALWGGRGRWISLKLYNAAVTLLPAYPEPRMPK